MQRANIHPFSLQNTLRTSPAFASNQKISFWTALAVNAPDGPSIREIGIAWTAVSSNASTVQECQSWEARNNSFCPYCRKLYLPPDASASMRALLPIPHLVRSFPMDWVLFTCIVFTGCRSVRLHFRPSRLHLRSRYRSIVARAPKLQGRSSSLHGSDLKKLVQCRGLDARLI